MTLGNLPAAREHGGGGADARGEAREDVGGLRLGPLSWIVVIFAAGFARYFLLAVRDVDGQLAAAAATSFVSVCTVAAAELFGWLRRAGEAGRAEPGLDRGRA